MKQGLKCRKCGNVIFSFSRHDFKECECGECFVDGGNDYFRYGTNQPPQIIEFDMSEKFYPLYFSQILNTFIYIKDKSYVVYEEDGEIEIGGDGYDPVKGTSCLGLVLMDSWFRPNLKYRASMEKLEE